MTTEQPISAASAPAEAEKRKRPASQYYWGDWWKDKGLHSCSLTARGLWHEMNCLMHEGEPYGHLTLNGRPMTPAQLANQCRISASQCARLLRELEDAGVPSRTPDGVIFSRRMVRDEVARNARAEGGKAGAEHGAKGAAYGSKGGRPRARSPIHGDGGGGLETPLGPTEYPPPASASASASAIETTERGDRAPPPEVEGQEPTAAGLACRAIKAGGITDVNPGHPDLHRLLAAGATPATLQATAAELVGKGKGRFAYLLSTVEGRMRDAAAAGDVPMAPPVTVPSADTRGEAYLAEHEQRAKEATRPPKDLLALARRSVRTPA